MRWGIDFYDAEWPLVKANLDQMAAAGMAFAVFKATMGLGDTNHQLLQDFTDQCKQLGVMYGLYGWCDPIYGIDQQITRFGQLIQAYTPFWVAMDFEQYWADWDQYTAFLKHQITDPQVSRLTPAKVDAAGKAYLNGLNQAAVGRAVLVYTNWGFVKNCSYPSKDWIKSNLLWDAGYLQSGPKTFKTWAEFNTALAILPPRKPSIPGVPEATIWQFTSSWTLPGLTSVLDLNVIQNEVLFQRLGGSGVAIDNGPGSGGGVVIDKGPGSGPVDNGNNGSGNTPAPIGNFVVNTDVLRVRDKPDPNGFAFKVVTRSMQVTGWANVAGWIQIDGPDKNSWVWGAFLKPA